MNDDKKLPKSNNPVGSLNKEKGPLGDFLRPSDHADIGPEISQELESLNVRATNERPNLTDQHKGAGIEHAKESVSVLTVSSGQASLPSKEETQSELKKTKPTSSLYGLLLLLLKNIKRAKA